MNTHRSIGDRFRTLLKDYGFKVIQAIERLNRRYSLVGNPAFFDPADFPWASVLEAHWETIRREVDGVLMHRHALPNFQDISKDQVSITTDDDWKTFFLYGFGYKAEANCMQCPETTKLVEAVPDMLTTFFSILSPGKHIPEHRGLFNGLVRYHLGLKVPEPRERCRIRVDDQVAHWEEGKSMLFDDTYPHEVWNDTDGVRVVLFMDVLRPLPRPLTLFNKLIIRLVALSPYVQDAKKKQEHWEKRLQEVIAPR